MENQNYQTPNDVLRRAMQLVRSRRTFGNLDVTGRLSDTNRGDLGQIVEENWYGYAPNNDAEPDFPEAEVELKVSPYKMTGNGPSAKERLVCNIINYMEEYNRTFETSAFWHKCKRICLLSYEWRSGVPKSELFVDQAVMIDGFPEEDMPIIMRDWEIIIEKIRRGEAHLISEGDTMYLAACTKGATAASSLRDQPFNTERAKQRAYSLKTTYMTRLLRKYIFGEEEDEHIITDTDLLLTSSFEDLVIEKFNDYLGKNTVEIGKRLNMTVYEPDKGFNASVVGRILGITGNHEQAAEFKNANITVKTIVVNSEDMPEQHMSFSVFSFLDIMKEKWEDSEIYDEMVAAKFLFVVFQRDDKSQFPVLRQVFFWNMPYEDVAELRRVFIRTKWAIRHGANLNYKNGTVYNSLPKSSESKVAHVRPHTEYAAYILADGTTIGIPEKYANPLPNGEWMTKQSFWFNKEYICKAIKNFNQSNYGKNDSNNSFKEDGHAFGCCHLYEECSDAKKCLHENQAYAKGCIYGKHLAEGRIFYGKNRNV